MNIGMFTLHGMSILIRLVIESSKRYPDTFKSGLVGGRPFAFEQAATSQQLSSSAN